MLTVLNQPTGDRHDAAVRWRQLVDLVARAGPMVGNPTVADALEVIRTQAPDVDEELRAAAARAVAARPLPLGLLEYFVSDRLTVSAPVLAAASLDVAQWRGLLSVADEETRRFVETLHPEIGATPPSTSAVSDLQSQIDALAAAVNAEAPRSPPPMAAPSLSEVVARIERRRRSRDAQRQRMCPLRPLYRPGRPRCSAGNAAQGRDCVGRWRAAWCPDRQDDRARPGE